MLLTLLISLFSVSQFTMSEGLSQNTVFSITQDAEKNMWFATYDGINRFDGYYFRQYRPERDPEFVQVEGADQKVFADSRGQIWAYDGGLSRYDKKSDSFIPVTGDSGGALTCFMELPGGKLLAAIDGRIKEFDIDAPNPSAKDSFYDGDDASAMDAAFGTVAVGTFTGILRLFHAGGTTEASICKDKITSLLIAAEDEIWATCEEGSVFRYRPSEKKLRVYSRLAGTLPSNASSEIKKDRNGRILLGTRKGLYIYDRERDAFELGYAPSDKSTILKSIYSDSEGDIWLGSSSNGVFYCHEEESPFTRIRLGFEHEEIRICSINEAPDGKMWISTLHNGLYVYDPESGRHKRLRLPPETDENGIMKIWFAPDGRIWFGSGSGLAEYDSQRGRLRQCNGKGFPRSVYSIIPAGGKRLWLGTLSGVYLFDSAGETIKRIESSTGLFVYKLFEEEDGTLWAASESGLYRAKVNRDIVENISCGEFEKVTDAWDVHDILSNGSNLVAAARNGLYVRDRQGKWNHYDKSDGLSSNFINGIECDYIGDIWIGTEYGLNRLDTSSGDISRFFADDGTGVDYYTKNSHCCAADRTIWFGGLGGLISIDPTLRKKSYGSAAPRINEFLVNGSVQPFDDTVLQYEENSVGFRFTVPNYSSRRKDVFRYRLLGVDNEWRVTNNPYSDNYASLRPGKYRFELKSFNKSGVESYQMASLEFIIRRPWWASRMAIAFYVIIALGLILLLIFKIDEHHKKKAQEEIDRITAFSQAGIDRLTVLHYTKDPVAADDAAFILKAVRTMEANIANESFGVEQLADILCMSRSNLYIRIKKLTGESALQFVHKVRLEKACELLKESDKPIADIAYETGFGSAAYFSTCFKREKGVSPNRWRK